MINRGQHYRIFHYLRTPILDVDSTADDLVAFKALNPRAEHLSLYRPGAIRTICLAELENPRAVPGVWELLMDNGCLILGEISDEAMKEIRKQGGFMVCEREPFVVIRKLQSARGEMFPTPKKVAPQGKNCLVIRYGAFGDAVMMMPVLDRLKAEGWFITLHTVDYSAAIWKNDPRVDELVVQEFNLMPPDDRMKAYWAKWEPHFDRVVNLTGSVENSLLRHPRGEHANDSHLRRMLDCTKDYLDAHMEAAGYPGETSPLPNIWLSEKEKDWAAKEIALIRRKSGKSFIVLWNLMGSSFHKMYPWMFDVWKLVDHNRDDLAFLTVGDNLGHHLEDPQFKCIVPRAGKYSIRQTLAMHSVVDGVVTTETMSLFAGLANPTPVIALLSHSDKSQYKWREFDYPMAPKLADCPCYPCHILHKERCTCPRGVVCHDSTLCMDSIDPTHLYDNLLQMRAANVHHACNA